MPATSPANPLAAKNGSRWSTPAAPSQAQRHAPSPHRTTQVLLVIYLLGACFQNYWIYSRAEHLDPGVWLSFVNGTGTAPEQYRIGVKLLAWWIVQHMGGGFRHAFALTDVVFCVPGMLLLYDLLRRSTVFRKGSLLVQWFGSATFLTLTFLYLGWLPWFEKAETLPCVGLVALLLWLWTDRTGAGSLSPAEKPSGHRHVHKFFLAAGILLCTVALCFVRADVACLLSAGFLLACLSRSRLGLSLRRPGALALSAAGVVASLLIQGWLMLRIYPGARYGPTPVFMLPHDIGKPQEVAPFLAFLLPVLWTAFHVRRRSREVEGAGLGLLLGALLYIPCWMAFGKLDEVRIFLPFALALAPLTTEAVLLRVQSLTAGTAMTARVYDAS